MDTARDPHYVCIFKIWTFNLNSRKRSQPVGAAFSVVQLDSVTWLRLHRNHRSAAILAQ